MFFSALVSLHFTSHFTLHTSHYALCTVQCQSAVLFISLPVCVVDKSLPHHYCHVMCFWVSPTVYYQLVQCTTVSYCFYEVQCYIATVQYIVTSLQYSAVLHCFSAVYCYIITVEYSVTLIQCSTVSQYYNVAVRLQCSTYECLRPILPHCYRSPDLILPK